MSGETPKNSGFVPTTIEGQGGISVSGSGHVVVSSGGPGGVGAVVQEFYGENQQRPTTLQEALPGNLFFDILTLNVTTKKGNFLDIDAYLGATVSDLGFGAQFLDAGIRLLIDGVSTGLGASTTQEIVKPEPFVSFAMTARVAVAPGDHVVTLQWSVGAPNSDTEIKFVTVDRDGCSMFVREVV